ncbi:hypothetical protein ACWDG1_09650 [Streptomyces sp. NPDC001177]
MSTRRVPDVAVRLAARFGDPLVREITPALGRRSRPTAEKAQGLLGRQTVLDRAESLIEHGVAGPLC